MRLDAPEELQEEEEEVQEEEVQEQERQEQVGGWGGEVDGGVAGWELEWRVEGRRELTTSGRF